MFYKNLTVFFLPIIIVILLFTRFYGINWGFPHFFHPDENNMAAAVSQFSPANFDPNFYAYGQFPLYLAYLIKNIFGFPDTFSSSILSLRLISALFSVLSVLVLYFSSALIFPKIKYIFLILLTFTPGLIQLAHFGTTESLLIFVFSANIFLALKYHQTSNHAYLLFSSITTAIGLATKITAIFFTLPIIFSFFFSPSHQKLISLVYFLQHLVLTFLLFLLLSPYNWLNFPDFLSSFKYESSVATGALPVFYTTQFQNTPDYLFPLLKIFPHSSGIIIYIFAILSIFLLRFPQKKQISKLLIFLLPLLIYFLYFGQTYVKWSRFISPLFFLPPLAAAFFISRFHSPVFKIFLITLSVLPGIFFFSHYFFPDIRQTASLWFNQNIPPNSQIFSEAGNVVNFPLDQSSYLVTNFDFYSSDDFSDKLISQITLSDYIIVPSRRVYKNYMSSGYPLINNYYQNLFSGRLGFELIKTFSPKGEFILNSESAEETWSVFDRPTIRVYKKQTTKSQSELESILSINSHESN